MAPSKETQVKISNESNQSIYSSYLCMCLEAFMTDYVVVI